MENRAALPASNILGVIGMIAALAAVLALTYYATRFIGKMLGGQFPEGGHGGPVTIRSRLIAAKGVYLMTAVYNKKEYLLGVSERQVTVLDCRTLEPQELEDMCKPAQGGFPARFQSALRQYAGRNKSGDGE